MFFVILLSLKIFLRLLRRNIASCGKIMHMVFFFVWFFFLFCETRKVLFLDGNKMTCNAHAITLQSRSKMSLGYLNMAFCIFHQWLIAMDRIHLKLRKVCFVLWIVKAENPLSRLFGSINTGVNDIVNWSPLSCFY